MTILSDFEQLFDDLAAADAFGSAQHLITFTIQGARVLDPLTGKMTGSLPTVYSASGWIVGSSEKQFKEWIAGDSVFVVKQSALGYRPLISDRPDIAGKEYSVIELRDDKAGGSAGGGVAYKIHLRGG